MKILVLSDDFPPESFGGAGKIAFLLAKSFRDSGHDVLVVTTVRSVSDTTQYELEGVKVKRIVCSYPLKFISYKSLWNRKVVNQVKVIIGEFEPDIVHVHNIHTYLSYGSIVASRKSGAKVFLTCHDVMSFNYSKLNFFINRKDLSVPLKFDYHISAWRQFRAYRSRYNPFRNVFIRYVFRKYVNKIIAVSDALKQALNQNGIKNVQVIHNGIDAGMWNISPEYVRQFKNHWKLGEEVILFGGRLTGIKGGFELIQAFEQVLEKHPNAQMLVLGKRDSSAEKLLSFASKKGIDKNIIFTSWLSGNDLKVAYHCASLVTVPSLCFDSFPTTNLEAMACKKPVIATCFGGSCEIVRHNQTGLIINPFNVKVFSEKISELLNDTAKMEAFGRQGYERLVNEFSLKICLEAYLDLFIN